LRRFARHLDQAPFAAVLAFLGVITGLRGLVDPNIYPVHFAMHGLDAVWAVTFLLGGAGIFIGRGIDRAKVEAAGCALFAGGAMVEAFAYLAFLGWTRTSSWVTVMVLVVFAFGAMRRWTHLIRGERQIWVKFDG
jgi:hypothetical protein